jgi:RNA polymerase sigma-70 factor (ECF subfamily)
MGKSPDNPGERSRLNLASAYEAVAPRLGRQGVRRAIDGEDVAQDAALRVLQAAAREPIEDPVRYFLRVARNLFVDAERRRGRTRAVIDGEADPSAAMDGAAGPERILAGKQRLEQALAVIDALPPRCREAFRLHRFEGLSYVQIARQMGVSPSMVEKHIAEAMLRLVRALGNSDE